MTESQFLQLVGQALEQVEDALESGDIPADCSRIGDVLTIELEDGARIVLNAQTPTRQLWLAARNGAMHFAWDGRTWIDVRTGAELFAALSRVLTQQLGHSIELRPD